MWTKKFWKDLGERIVVSAAQGALAVVLAAGVDDWRRVLGGAGVAALISLLKGLIASQMGKPDSASLVQ